MLTTHSYDGEVVDPGVFTDPEQRAKINLPEFLGRHSKDTRYPEILACANELKSRYTKTAAIGYCWGAWACFRLGADPSVIDAISMAHPSLVEKSDIENIKVPVQIMAPENDQAFTPELKEYANKVIPTLGVPYEVRYTSRRSELRGRSVNIFSMYISQDYRMGSQRGVILKTSCRRLGWKEPRIQR